MIHNPYVGMRVIMSDQSVHPLYRIYLGQIGTIKHIHDHGRLLVRFDFNGDACDFYTSRFDPATPENIAKWEGYHRVAQDQKQREEHADKYL